MFLILKNVKFKFKSDKDLTDIVIISLKITF